MRRIGLGLPLRKEAELSTLTLDVVKSSEIEGVKLDAEQVGSSIARHLGLDTAGMARCFPRRARSRERETLRHGPVA